MMVSMVLAEIGPWDCPNCGRKGNTDNFCGECGAKAPIIWDCPSCGRTGIIDKYCSTCGTERPKPLEVGQNVTFGRYPQTSNATEQTPIEWIVLEVKDGKALLLSKYGLDTKLYCGESFNTLLRYNGLYEGITWERSSLREWLNKEFLIAAFSEVERRAIQNSKVDNSRSISVRIRVVSRCFVISKKQS
jgi:hypothetical protein